MTNHSNLRQLLSYRQILMLNAFNAEISKSRSHIKIIF